MKVLGIDPGLSATGYGVVEQLGNRMTPLAWGVIRSKGKSLAERLSDVHQQLREQIEHIHPDIVAVEEIFIAINPRSALLLGHARGAAILTAGLAGCKVVEYPANSIKQSVAGRGGASKQQVEFMVRRLLNLTDEKMLPDASDALAVAICCIMKNGVSQASRGSSKRTNDSILLELAAKAAR